MLVHADEVIYSASPLVQGRHGLAGRNQQIEMRTIMLAISLLSVRGLAGAEGGSPSGMIPYGGTGLSSCGFVPAGAIRIVPFAIWLSVFSS